MGIKQIKIFLFWGSWKNLAVPTLQENKINRPSQFMGLIWGIKKYLYSTYTTGLREFRYVYIWNIYLFVLIYSIFSGILRIPAYNIRF